MNKRHYLSMEVDNKNVKIRNILNKDFLEVELYAVADHYPNRNNSHFTLGSMEDALPTFSNKPILGSFRNDDFQGHESDYVMDPESGEGYFDNSKPYDEVPLGLITESSKIEIVKGQDGANWIKVTGYLWVKYATKQILSLLRKRKGRTKVSIECEVLDSHVDEKGVEVIEKFNLLGVTILGSYKGPYGKVDIQEGISGASMKVLNFSTDPNFQEKLAKLTFAVQQLEEANKNNFNQNNQSDESIANEHVDEIEFGDDNEVGSDDRKEKSPMFFELTMGQKMQILNNYLDKQRIENEYLWVCDFDSTHVYIRTEDGTLKVPYEVIYGVNNEILNVSFDFAQAEKVVESWQTYTANAESFSENTQEAVTSAENMDNDKIVTMSENDAQAQEAQVENFSENAGDNSAAIEAETGIVMVMDHDGEGHDDNHGDGHGHDHDGDHCECSENSEDPDNKAEHCNNSAENPEDNSQEGKENHCNNSAEGCENHEEFADGPQENPVNAPAQEPHETPVNAEPGEPHDNPSDTGENQYNTDYTDGMGTTTPEAISSVENVVKYVKIGEEQVDIDQLFERYTALSADYVTLTNNFNAMKAEYDAMKETAENARKESLTTFANNMIDAETFADEKKENMRMSVNAGIEDGSLADEDAVKKFTVNMIAMALYEAREAAKANHSAVEPEAKSEKSEKTEFVQTIVKPAVEKSKLAVATEKLKNL